MESNPRPDEPRAHDRWDAFASRVGTALRDTSTEVYFADTQTYRFLCVNDAACRSLGYSYDELVNMTITEVSVKFDRAGMEQRLAALRSGEISEVLRDSVHIRSDGSTYPVELQLLICRDEAGEVLIGLAHDVTARREAERALSDSRERLELAVRGAGVTVWNSDLVNGLNYFDEQLATMMGLPTDGPLSDASRADWLHPDDVARVREAWSSHLKGESETYEVEFRALAAGNEIRWLRASGRVMERDPDGEPLRAAGTFLDITEQRRTAETLATFEAELRTLFENSSDVIAIVAPDGEILRVNRGALRSVSPAGPYQVGGNIYHYAAYATYAGPNVVEVIHDCMASALEGNGKTVELGGRVNGSEQWFEFAFSRVDGPDASQPKIALFLRDITERRIAEHAVLREQRILTEIASAAAAATSPYELMVALRRPMSEVIPRPWIDFGYVSATEVRYPVTSGQPIVTPHDAGVVDALTRGQSHWYGYDEPSPGADKLKAAGVFAASLTTSSIGGQPLGLLLAASRDPGYEFNTHDLGLLKVIAGIVGPPMANLRTTEEVNRQRALYDTALSSLSEAVILLDETGEPLFANEPGKEIVNALAFLPDGIPDESVSPSIPSQVVLDYEAAIGRREGRSGTRVPVVVEAESRWYDYEFVPLEFDPPRTLVVAKNVSLEVEKERAEERHRDEIAKASRLSALGGLIGGVAHELNNPLTAILGFTEIIEADGGAFTEEVAIIKQEALRARDIVRDLLFIVRPGPVEFGEVVLADVVQHVERLRRTTWRQRGIHSSMVVDDNSPRIAGNAHHITQVLLNLTTNAEDALLGAADPQLEISVRKEGGEAVVAVSDNGAGMDKETSGRIFEPFFTTKAGKGTGLGLSVLNNIVTIHGGSVAVESSPGKGTRFEVRLPLWAGDGDAGTRDTESETATKAARRILVIDDEPTLRTVARRLFESLGHHCVAVGTVADALSAIAAETFDLVICDYRLGGETATQFVDGLPESSRAVVVPRLVIATGATTDEGVSRLVEQNQLRLLPKPYGIQQLTLILSEAPGVQDPALRKGA